MDAEQMKKVVQRKSTAATVTITAATITSSSAAATVTLSSVAATALSVLWLPALN
ncbi:hypothetical protein DPMN_094716 [Dreissena polymorpha]|uniref:Uncharacterized protein n=1 Tax=Dreissena polymorpha TaxID=45954 RepID=A0A9D4L579_DREPO|nr:hypothetical protein DPMN_094716 [Dreissena polymorpha]